MDTTKRLSKEISETIVKEQTSQIYKSDAQNLAQRISDFLKSCELDLEILTQIPITPESYLQFSNTHHRWVNSTKSSIPLYKSSIPLYKEIAYINSQGEEIIKIVDNVIIPKDQLKNVSIIENTTFKSETYFWDTRKSKTDIDVSHLTGWYISRREQLEQGRSYSGVIRFCKKIKDKEGNFSGICMIALDHRHIMDFIWPNFTEDGSLLDSYRLGNYTYIFDDEGWIIAHPKLWDIRGLDKNGIPVEPFTEETPKWTIDAGMLPVNLLKMDWRLRDIYTQEPISSIVKRVQRGEIVLAMIRSLGITGNSEGVVRTRVYAPIHYGSGTYGKYGIFGGVVVGTSLEDFLDNTRVLTAQMERISEHSKKRMILLASFISLAVLFFSFFVARTTAQSMRKLNDALVRIGQGNFVVSNINSSIKEITELSQGVK